MPSLYNAEVQKANAEAEFAEIEYRNTKGLADSNVVAPNELAMSKAKLNTVSYTHLDVYKRQLLIFTH